MASIVQPLNSTVRIVEWDELPARVRRGERDDERGHHVVVLL